MHSEPAPFAQRLIVWQKRHGRHDLPWQQSRDPYRIWLSEIMLQQTQVATVLPYYQRFLERYPDLSTLAAASLNDVLEAWSGLGYYARGRNLHQAAQQVMQEFSGRFPSDPATIAELPGIGRSTAAAIAVFAFGARAAILDGNVKRILCRHAGIEGFPGLPAIEKKLWALAESRLPRQKVEAYTQGLMDLGSGVCMRHRPVCTDCPLSADCIAFVEGRQNDLPSPKPRSKLPERTATFVLITDGRAVLLKRRPPKGLWGGLLVPPEGNPETILGELGFVSEGVHALPELKHRFTHFQLTLRPVVCPLTVRPAGPDHASWHWQELGTLEQAALPTPVRRILRGGLASKK
ncbi:MAG: A/G-specific adenine glycosylase [Betaproteobacteria bacterium ADurb.Bin341]|nr:MAG: A/G-specific adenine glycosylase [Betaproteobacteria bacterium ADurb.Bin341]